MCTLNILFLTWGPTGDGWLTVGIYPRHLPQPFNKKKFIGKHIYFLIQEPTVADIGHSSRQLFFMYKILRHTFQYISDLEATFWRFLLVYLLPIQVA